MSKYKCEKGEEQYKMCKKYGADYCSDCPHSKNVEVGMSEKEAIKQIKSFIEIYNCWNSKEFLAAKRYNLGDESEEGVTIYKKDIDAVQTVLQLLEQKDTRIDELKKALIEEDLKHRDKISKLKEHCKDTIKEEREFMKDLEHKNVAFHYANGRETLSKEILKILEE